MSDMPIDDDDAITLGDTVTTSESMDTTYEPTDSDSEEEPHNLNVMVGEPREQRVRVPPLRFANQTFPPMRRKTNTIPNVVYIDSDTDSVEFISTTYPPSALPQSGENCVICMDALNNGDGTAPPCAQCKQVVAHIPCLMQAAEYSEKCPLCRFASA